MDSKQQHIFHSKLPDIKIPNHLPLHTYCFQNLSNHRDQPALINAATGETFTHHGVYVTAKKFAAGLHQLGVHRRHVIMLLLHNSPEFAFSFLGASYAGAATTTANPLYTASEITKQAEISKPELIVTHARYVEKLNRFTLQNNAIIVTIDDPPSPSIIKFSDLIKTDQNLIPPEIEFSGEDTAALPFSSGTTGLPKGVMLSHQNVVTCVAQQVDGDNPNFYIDGRDLILCVLPLFHVYSLLTVLLCGLRVGASVLIVEKYEIYGLMEVMERFKVTIAPFVPPILLSLAKIAAEEAAEFDLTAVRRVVCGAAPMDEKLQGAVRVMFPNATIGQGYGMTEAGVLTMCLGFAKSPFKFKPGSCGTVIRNAQMKVVDPSTGASLPQNQTGEICIRGPQVMKGYLNDGEATSMTIDKDGWLHTGDIGYVDSDDEVFIVDRLKELIKYKGFHVAPAQLEALLIAHPSISEAAVVPMKDEVAGEVPVAFVVKANGSNISEQEIKHYISKQVVSYKRINRVFFIDEIPKAPSGKILRKNLRPRI